MIFSKSVFLYEVLHCTCVCVQSWKVAKYPVGGRTLGRLVLETLRYLCSASCCVCLCSCPVRFAVSICRSFIPGISA